MQTFFSYLFICFIAITGIAYSFVLYPINSASHLSLAHREENIDNSKLLNTINDQKRKISEVIRQSTLFYVFLSKIKFQNSMNANAAMRKHSGKSIINDGKLMDLSESDNQILKRPDDDRKYKAFTLDNGLKVLLISDERSTKSAAAIDVHVGSFSDPKTIPGLAHFCEHMSFLGTKKYPNEAEFSSFLSSHGGNSNAYTDNEDTVYYFDINSDYFDGALDRFSQFFISPLFTESATARELNAIESEHSKNINNDAFRIYQLDKDGANPNHPLNRFATGNKYTLETYPLQNGINIRQALIDFHSKYYSANLMTLCLYGQQDIANLEKIVRNYFTDVPNRLTDNPSNQWWGKVPPYYSQLVNFQKTKPIATALEIVPIRESISITISWPIWIKSLQQREEFLIYKPEYVLSHLIGHEGKGSIRSFLTKKSWANGVQAAISEDISDNEFFSVTVDLTEDGYQHRYDVIDVIFGYLDLIKKQGIPEYIYEELKQLSQIGFDYSEKSEPIEYVSSIAANMQIYHKPKEYLTGPRIFNRLNTSLVQEYLDQLRPELAKLLIISPTLKGKTNQISRYYETPFNNITLPKETTRWSHVTYQNYQNELSLPIRNDLIPMKFDLVSSGIQSKSLSDEQRKTLLSEPPRIIRQDSTWTVWYKLDKVFKQPKVYAIFSLAVPKVLYNPLFVVNSKIFEACFYDYLNEYLYDARLAGLGFEMDFTSRGLQIILTGFNDKFNTFALQILQKLKAFEVQESAYQRIKDVLRRDYSSWKTQQPYQHASYYATQISETLQFSIHQLQDAVDRSTLDQLKNFITGSIAKSYGTALFAGNILPKSCLEVVNIVESTFPFDVLPSNEQSNRKVTIIPRSLDVKNLNIPNTTPVYDAMSSQNGKGIRLLHPEPNINDINCASIFYFQLPSRVPSDYVFVELLSEILQEPFYNSLRTQQQLGYLVFSSIKSREGICSLAFAVQSSVVDGDELTKRINSFTSHEAIDIVKSLNKDEFDAFKQGLITKLSEPDQRLSSQASRLWSEIVASKYFSSNQINAQSYPHVPLFNRAELEIKALKSVTKKNLLKFIESFLLVDGDKCRLLVSQIDPAIMKINEEGKGKNDSDLLNIINDNQLKKLLDFI